MKLAVVNVKNIRLLGEYDVRRIKDWILSIKNYPELSSSYNVTLN